MSIFAQQIVYLDSLAMSVVAIAAGISVSDGPGKRPAFLSSFRQNG
ncbi:MAG: hypothetical protein AAFO87_10155 [Cyanobacteria bacterium J06607_6]